MLRPGMTRNELQSGFARSVIRAKTKEDHMTATAKKPAFTDYIVKDISLAEFGRNPDNEGGFSWEKTDLTDALKRAV